MRFTRKVELWLVKEKAKTKAKVKQEKRDACGHTAYKEKQAKKKPKLDPPKPPVMAFEFYCICNSHKSEVTHARICVE